MTRPYSELTTPGQIRRLRLLAKDALPRFRLRADTPLKLLNHGENTTFRVEDARGRLRVLRLHRPGYQTTTAIRSELMWLSALARDTDLRVPAPITGRDGGTVQVVSHRLVEQPHACTLLTWIPGRFRIRGGSHADYALMGRLGAELHQHGAQWKRPAGFRRRAWTEKGLVSPNALWGDPIGAPYLRAAQRRVLEAARERLLDELGEYGRAKDRFGLIHADLHTGNVLVHEGRAYPIDFDDCGAGWFMYDAAVSLLTSLQHPKYADAKAGYLEGYRSVRDLDDIHVDAIDRFIIARRLAITGWLTKRADNPRLARWLPRIVKWTLTVSRRYIKTGRIE